MRAFPAAAFLLLLTGASVAEIRAQGSSFEITAQQPFDAVEKCINDAWSGIGTVSSTAAPGGRTLTLNRKAFGPFNPAGPRFVIDLLEGEPSGRMVIFHPKRSPDLKSLRTVLDHCARKPA